MLVAPGAAVAQQLDPGLWYWSRQIISVSGPGLTPSVAATLTTKPASVERQCLTPAQAKRGFDAMLREKRPDCRVHDNHPGSNVIDLSATCGAEGGRAVTMRLSGPVSPIDFSLTAESRAADVTMTMVIHGKRIGRCP